MSKFSKLGLRRVVGAAAIASVAALGLAGMGAGDAAAFKLPGGYKKATGIDGEVVQTWRSNESAYAIGTVANNPTARGFVISGNYQTKASAGVNGNIAVKYIVGCQVDVTGLELGLSGALDIIGQSASVAGSLSFPLKPGQVGVVDVTDTDFSAGKPGVIQLSQLSFNVNGCGGFASARSVVKVIAAKGYNTDDGTVNGEGTLIQSTLYGKPFSIN